ncbi:MAG: isopeptide-forming domain-containing fimbrial protein [Candidatus Peribacteria bacterium]|nr:isopeptide-forming domain-containing fimbrial protein [Candidatus Peribacteria bacterium]
MQFSQPIAQAFPFYSNGKPANVNSVVITATPISISSTIPADYSRNTVAAQLVYEIHRYERGFTAASNGKFSVTYLAEGASSSQKFLYNNADPILPTVSDKECRNIYVGFCGDGVIDNTNIKSSTNIRAALAGGEECDPNHPDYIGKGTCSQDCKKITPPSTATGVITKVLVSPQYVTTTGEQVTWRITLTASGGNLNLANHTIKEKLPAELEYVSYTVTTPNGVTVNAPTIAGNIITWALNGTLAQNNSIVINLATKVKQMPPAGNTVRNVACFAKNT